MMQYLPIHLKLEGVPCLLVGAGTVALRKASLLLQAGAQLTVVAAEILPELSQLLMQYHAQFEHRAYQKSDLIKQRLVVVATDDAQLNKQVYEDAVAVGIWVNVVDTPDLCRFIFPAIVDRSPLMLSVSSSGQAPVLTRMLRAKLESLFPGNYGKLVEFLGAFRHKTRVAFASVDERRKFWEQVLEGSIIEWVLKGQIEKAESGLKQAFLDHQNQLIENKVGEVYLVGAGPGDPDLLTFRALRLMQKADVVVYDRLVSQPILDMARRDAEKIYAGKARNRHSIAQTDINQLLVSLAKKGKRVCRLKGGDPFIFGRGGEEIESLLFEQVPFQVVPGVTAAAGCAAYAGIPLTHRDYAQSVRFITGHLKQGQLDLDWSSLVVQNETLVFYMGLLSLPIICTQLIAHGMPADMPVALVQQGTLQQQKVYRGLLREFSAYIEQQEVKSPSLLIVGQVVRLQDQLKWFQTT